MHLLITSPIIEKQSWPLNRIIRFANVNTHWFPRLSCWISFFMVLLFSLNHRWRWPISLAQENSGTKLRGILPGDVFFVLFTFGFGWWLGELLAPNKVKLCFHVKFKVAINGNETITVRARDRFPLRVGLVAAFGDKLSSTDLFVGGGVKWWLFNFC